MLDWDDLRFLLAIRETGSASSAARRLGVDKATVSRRATRLEQQLGVRLLSRRASGWQATAAGERAAHAARAIERSIETLRADYASEHGAPRTPVSVTAPHWFCSELLLPALPGLLRQGPWLDVSIAASSRVLNLAQREADVALRNSRPAQGDFVVRRAGSLGSALYAARSYVEQHPVPQDEAGWKSHRIVGYVDRITYVPGFRWFEAIGGQSAAIVRTDDASALTAALVAGIGVGVIPCFLGDRAPELVRMGDELHREAIWIVSPSDAASTRAVKMAAAFVAGVFASSAKALAG